MNGKRILAMILAAALPVLSTACGGAPSPEVDTVDNRDHFYGVCYGAYEWQTWHGLDYKTGFQALKALGAQSVRLWIHSDFILDDPNTVNEENLRLMKEIVAEAKANDLEVVGMNHHWFSGGSDFMAVPNREIKDGSPYAKFLLNYQATWETMASALPEIELWEIGNEWNNDTFLHPYEYGSTGLVFTITEKARIAADLLYYASKGIHAANPAARTMLGGLVDVVKDGYGNAKGFLKKLYENIQSGEYPSTDPDDYFQILSWHPYILDGPATDKWVEHNQAIYELAREYEGKDKPVYFTELGWSDYASPASDAEQAAYLTDVLTRIREEMPFVEAVHWFTLFNDVKAYSWGGEKEVNFGLFTDPVYQDFAPKEKGKAFQQLTGSSADLDRFRTAAS